VTRIVSPTLVLGKDLMDTGLLVKAWGSAIVMQEAIKGLKEAGIDWAKDPEIALWFEEATGHIVQRISDRLRERGVEIDK
jgi:hypothetical protein